MSLRVASSDTDYTLVLQTLEKVKELRNRGDNKAAEILADEQSLMYTDPVSSYACKSFTAMGGTLA